MSDPINIKNMQEAIFSGDFQGKILEMAKCESEKTIKVEVELPEPFVRGIEAMAEQLGLDSKAILSSSVNKIVKDSMKQLTQKAVAQQSTPDSQIGELQGKMSDLMGKVGQMNKMMDELKKLEVVLNGNTGGQIRNIQKTKKDTEESDVPSRRVPKKEDE